MDSEYPPLPPSGALRSSFQSLSLDSIIQPTSAPGESPGCQPGDSSSTTQSITKVISRNGDVVIDYTDRDMAPDSRVSYRWRVASEDLMLNSPYFRALLDPNKFSEGRNLLEQKMNRSHNASLQTDDQETNPTSNEDICNALPKVNLPVDNFTRRLGVDAIELFLRILSVNSLADEEKAGFAGELRFYPTSLVARLVEVADVFNSPNIVRDMLQRSGYSFGKGKIGLNRFNPLLLKMSEERIRQIIFIADFLDERSAFQIFTHTLIIVGSKFWINGVDPPISDTLRWRYFSDGLEEELYYRRQCVLNTVTDLQAHFLRAYGAIEELDMSTATTTTIRPRPFQCRWGFGNSSACDIFHLGQMTRFFTMRTKTVFLGSSLIDPDFTLDPESHPKEDSDDTTVVTERKQSGPPADITAIIASLKQFPDYQIDANHTGCGVRRRIVPALDCIERFVGDSRGLLGIVRRRQAPLSSVSWTNQSFPKAHTIDIRSSRINAFRYSSPGAPSSQEEEARLFFTAETRNWEA